MKNDKSVVFGRKKRNYKAPGRFSDNPESGLRKERGGVENFIMLVGSLVIVAYFAFTLSGGAGDLDFAYENDAVPVSVYADTYSRTAESGKWSFWEYLSECLEQIFIEKGLV